MKPSEGVIYIDNTLLGYLKIHESAKKLAVVAQHNFYNFDFTVQEVVLMGRAPHKKQLERDNAEDYRITQEALEKVDMTDFSQRIFSTLSGGEQQRILLARALAQKTGCLILDEPTNHLDVKYQLQLLNVVKSLGLTVIAAMHDLNLAAMYCDFIYVLKDGEIKGCGTPKELLTVELLKEIYEVDAKVTEDKSTGIINIIFKQSNV
jgi:iron complex transport system ATP-binding protein